jgi:hypothetical protein
MVIRRSKECFLRNGSGTLAPSPARAVSSGPRKYRPHVGPRLSFYGRASAMQRSLFAIVLEVITMAAMVALVLYVLFPPN